MIRFTRSQMARVIRARWQSRMGQYRYPADAYIDNGERDRAILLRPCRQMLVHPAKMFARSANRCVGRANGRYFAHLQF